MNIRHNDALIDKLAAEYVLGTLRGGARRRFETWLRDNAALRRAVAEWEDRLVPLAEFAPAAKPSPQVWQSIAKRLKLTDARTESSRSFWTSLREDLMFWRGLGLVSTALATILVAVLATKQPEPASPLTSYVAMLADDKAQPIAIVTGDAKRRQLVVKMVASQTVAADKSLELWAVPKEGPPRSLGLVASNGSITLNMPENATPQTVPVLAVTLEPKGGSPKADGPTGPVVFKGAWIQI
ncbi:MAG: anti-sigma factor [Pseudomonadota bacterium]